MSRAQLEADVKKAQKVASRPLARIRHALIRYFGIWQYKAQKPTYYGVLPNKPRCHRWEV